MTPDRWEQIKDVFDAALELSPDERPRFLEHACRGDESIRLEVERLLGDHDRAGSFMENSPLPALLNSYPPKEPRTFVASEIVAERFRITRFIGQGGMGEVYEAEDLDLHERVALKTVRPLIAADTKFLEALKREIHHARKVTHPNVNRIFDLERHRRPGGVEIAFLTMELLDGETLAERLNRVGRMTISEARPLIEQMAAGLSAAHEAGIVHRHFKPGNVMLVGTTARAVITDFGLSHAVETQAASGAPSSGWTSGIFGTPPYIAPEQLKGGPVTPATDIYALGVVLYEMLTGPLPFNSLLPLSVVMQRLEESPIPPRGYLPEVDAKWRKLILRCLQRDPGDRFASATEVLTAIRGESLRQVDRDRRSLGLLAGLMSALSSAAKIRIDLNGMKRDSEPDRLSGRPGPVRKAWSSKSWWRLPVALCAAVVAGAVLVSLLARSAAVPRVSSDPVQITDDDEPKQLIGTDGPRLYLNKDQPPLQFIAQVSATGGRPERIPAHLSNQRLLSVSPDGSELLVVEQSIDGRSGPLWILSTIGGSLRRFSDFVGNSAAFSPDGKRVAYTTGGDVFLTKTDGTESHKVVSLPGGAFAPAWSPDERELRITAFD